MSRLTHYGGHVSDRFLVIAAQRGDQRAKDALVRRHDPLVRSVVRDLRLPLGVEFGDLLQCARLGVQRAVETWRPDHAPFRVYARTCARRRAIDAIDAARAERRRAATDAVSLDALIEAGREPVSSTEARGAGDPQRRAVAREQLSAMIAARVTLTERQDACLTGELNGRSCREIADSVGGTPKSVAMCARRARAALAAAAGLE